MSAMSQASVIVAEYENRPTAEIAEAYSEAVALPDSRDKRITVFALGYLLGGV